MFIIINRSEILTKIYCVRWKQIKDLMQDFSSKHIIPHMEQKIRVLNQQVVSSSIFYMISDMKETWYCIYHDFVSALLFLFPPFPSIVV